MRARQDARPAKAGYFTSPIAFSFWTARGALWTDRHFDDVVINAIFVVAAHVGDDALNVFNAHAGLDVLTQVVEQQHALLVITNFLFVVDDLALQFVLRRNIRTNSSTSWKLGLFALSIFIPLL